MHRKYNTMRLFCCGNLSETIKETSSLCFKWSSEYLYIHLVFLYRNMWSLFLRRTRTWSCTASRRRASTPSSWRLSDCCTPGEINWPERKMRAPGNAPNRLCACVWWWVIVIYECVVSPQIYLTKPHDDEDRWGASKVRLMCLINAFSVKVAHLWGCFIFGH